MMLPNEFLPFHRNKFINYQLNRWYSLGYAQKEDIIAVSPKIKNFDDYVASFTLLGEQALGKGHKANAFMYFRAAEFLVDPSSPEKIALYRKFTAIFDEAFEHENFTRHKVPFGPGYLNILKVPAAGPSKGTVIGLGGFDSSVEEFYVIWKGIAAFGYDVIAMEGPGQGGTLRLYNLPFDHDYEKPVGAVLDFFNITKAAILGISMGGYWAIRAAAFETRINRVIAMPPVYDWMELTHAFNKKLVSWLLKTPRLLNAMVKLKMKVKTLHHTVVHTLFITQKNTPTEAVLWMLGMNANHLHSENITQDVLLMVGKNDAFQPPKLTFKQKDALVNAKKVTVRIFTKEENADQHCQIGNVNIAIETIGKWLNDGSGDSMQ